MPGLEPLETTWTDAEGREHTVTTNPTNTDTQQTLEARYASLVALMQQAFPPV